MHHVSNSEITSWPMIFSSLFFSLSFSLSLSLYDAKRISLVQSGKTRNSPLSLPPSPIRSANRGDRNGWRSDEQICRVTTWPRFVPGSVRFFQHSCRSNKTRGAGDGGRGEGRGEVHVTPRGWKTNVYRTEKLNWSLCQYRCQLSSVFPARSHLCHLFPSRRA